MPGPTPLLATHRLQCTVIGGTRPHSHRWLVNAVADGTDVDGFRFVAVPGGIDAGMHAAVASLGPLVEAAYPASMQVGNWVLQQFVSGAYVPIGADTRAHAGTNAGAFTVAQQTTITLKNAANQSTKHILQEIPHPYVGRTILLATLSADLQALIVDMTTISAGTSGNWLRTRNATSPGRFISVVFTANRKMRRDAGLL